MNRQQRRAALRTLPSHAAGQMPPICKAGTHKLMPVQGTVKGEVVVRAVLCRSCRRTFQELLAEDAEYAAMYEAWRATGEPEEWPTGARVGDVS